MAHSLSSSKRIRQNLKRRARNRARQSTLKTQVRKCTVALARESGEPATTAFRAAAKALDQAASRGTIHRNAAARRKSRLARRLNAVGAKSPTS